MGIQYWPGLKQNEDSLNLAIKLLEKTFEAEVTIISLNEYIQSGISYKEVKNSLKKDYERALDNGYTKVVAVSSGASLFIAVANDRKAESVIFLAPTLKPINLVQMIKDKRKGIENDYKKFSFSDTRFVFRAALSASLNKKCLAGVPTLIIQGTKDELIRPRGGTTLQKKLTRYDKQILGLHEFHLMNGRHDLLFEEETREICLQIMQNFMKRNNQ